MRLPCICILAILCLTLSMRAEIDFTPRFAETTADGVPVRRLFFTDGTRRIFVRAPVRWRVAGSAVSATFMPPDFVQAYVKLENSPLASAPAFDKAGLPAYRKLALASLPDGAVDWSIASETPDAIAINNWRSHELVVNYVLGGQPATRIFLFVTLEAKRQILMTTDAARNDIERLRPGARATLHSWFEEVDVSKAR